MYSAAECKGNFILRKGFPHSLLISGIKPRIFCVWIRCANYCNIQAGLKKRKSIYISLFERIWKKFHEILPSMEDKHIHICTHPITIFFFFIKQTYFNYYSLYWDFFPCSQWLYYSIIIILRRLYYKLFDNKLVWVVYECECPGVPYETRFHKTFLFNKMEDILLIYILPAEVLAFAEWNIKWMFRKPIINFL